MRALAVVHQRDAGPGVFSEAMAAQGVELETWLPAEDRAPPRDPAGYDAALVFGGAMHADQERAHPWLAAEKSLLADLLDAGAPLLGVCLGAQLLSEAAGGTAQRLAEPEIGWLEVEVTDAGSSDPLLGPMAPRFAAFQWHSYECTLPPGAVGLAKSAACMQAYRVGEAAWGIQFHAEVAAVDAESWIRDYRSDEDAVRIGLDAEALRARTAERIGAWNQLGRELCARFLATVATPA